MPRVRVTSEAEEDILELAAFIASESGSKTAAVKFLEELDKKCWLYAEQPLMGKQRLDFDKNIRTFPLGNFTIIYEAKDDGIDVLMVIRSARDIPPIFRKRVSN